MRTWIKQFLFLVFCGLPAISDAQIDISVAGSIAVGSDAGTPSQGKIRWTGVQFEGYTGTDWIKIGRGRDTVITTIVLPNSKNFKIPVDSDRKIKSLSTTMESRSDLISNKIKKQ